MSLYFSKKYSFYNGNLYKAFRRCDMFIEIFAVTCAIYILVRVIDKHLKK